MINSVSSVLQFYLYRTTAALPDGVQFYLYRAVAALPSSEDVVQAFILQMGAISILLLTDPTTRHRRMALWIGVLSQPFWLWATYSKNQWGMFILALVYTFSYMRGLFLSSETARNCKCNVSKSNP